MALRTFHPCAFNFDDVDVRRVGDVASAGASISGFEDQVETDGGGYLQADFTNGETLDRETGLAWRAMSDLDAGEAVDVMLCAERQFQPVGAIVTVAHDDATPFDDGTLYSSPGAAFSCVADVGLRATQMQISGASELALIGGELFSILHPNWGWRAYRIRAVVAQPGGSFIINFRTPLREAVTAGTALEFDTPRCRMVITQKTSNPTNIGQFTACSISFREDMSPPASS